MFAGRGIALPGFGVTVLVVAGAFGLGVATGWATGLIPDLVQADPSASPSPSPTPSPTSDFYPIIPPMEPITRLLTQEDRDAGVMTTEITLRAEGTFSEVPGVGTPDDAAGDVRWVSIAVEDGVTADAAAFKAYVIDTLNANRGWGSAHAVQYVPTDGVADYRIVLASPYTTAVLCPDPHVTVPVGTVADASAEPSPPASANPESANPEADSPWSCGQGGVIVVSAYDWTAGFAAYAEDYSGSRTYLLNHRLGHLRGRDDVVCAGGRADIMVVQEASIPDGCEVNPWPNPDAPVDLPTPSASPTALPGAGTP